MKQKATRIGDVVQSVFSKIDREKRLGKEEIESVWSACAGGDSAAHSKPHSFRGCALIVYVDSPVWLQNLTLRKREILKALKRALGKDRITEIHLKIGDWNA